MQTIAAHSIPRIYSAYGIDLGQGYNESGKVIRREQYFCAECRTGFTVDHNYHGMQGYFDGFHDSVVYCPQCGRRHENWWNGPNYIGMGKDLMPESICLQLQEGKDLFILKAKMKTFRFVEDEGRYRIETSSRTEEFRFDVRHRKSELILRDKGAQIKERFEIGAPFGFRLLDASLLAHLLSSNHSKKYRDGITGLMKTLRERMRKKWKKIHGYDIGPLFVGSGTTYGKMLLPLMNMAFRLVYADAGNLPDFVGKIGWARDQALDWLLIGPDAMKKFAEMERIRKGPDTVSAVMGLFGIPSAPSLRKILSIDVFSAAELSEICKVTKNIDYVESLWHVMRDKINQYEGHKMAPQVYRLLQTLAPRYPMRSLLAYVKQSKWWALRDTETMLRRLLPERQENFWREKPKLKDLHDSLIQALKHQKENGFDLRVPEHVRKRLTMQMDRLRFFLPEHSFELMKIGDELHNCVRAYDEKMRAQECNVVPVADDNGKLVACLEVKGSRVVQAKLKHNRPVRLDAALNAEVIRWAGKIGLKIETSDIETAAEALEAATA